MNITATIEYLYRDGFTAKLNTSNKKRVETIFLKKLVAGVLGSFCILRAILIFGVGWGNFDIFVLFVVGVFLWFLVLSSS